jgi:proteasome activator subunit 4
VSVISIRLTQLLTIGYQVPSAEEVQFILDILDRVAAPALDKIETLARSTQHWDEVVRNDFCRQVAVQ